jgi:AMIN domain
MRPFIITALIKSLPAFMCNRLKRASLLAFAGIGLSLAGAPLVAAQAPATIRRVVISPDSGSFEVEISASRPVTPQTMVITGPDRLVIDFPNSLPGPDLHSRPLNRGKVKGIRVGLFTARPPVTRVVVDLLGPQPYQISPSGSSVVVKLNGGGTPPAESPLAHLAASAPAPHAPPAPIHSVTLPTHPAHAIPATTFSVVRVPLSATPSPAVHGASLPPGNMAPAPYIRPGQPPSAVPGANVIAANAGITPVAVPARVPLPPRMEVDFRNGKLKIVADHATLAAVLNEVHRKTGTQISVPAGGGMEPVFVSLGPAAPREVMAALLNGTHFNFIMVGMDNDASQLRSVILTPSSAGPADVPAPYSPPLAAQAPEYTPPTAPDAIGELPPPDPQAADDSTNVGVTPDSGEPDASAEQQPDAVVPRRPRSHRPAQEAPEQPQDPPQE